MLNLAEKTASANALRLQSVQTLVIGRLIVVFLLLVASWIWTSGGVDLAFEPFPTGPLLIFVVAVGLTAAYFLMLRLSPKFAWQVRAQFLIDALLIT